jgi:hypothetical protein
VTALGQATSELTVIHGLEPELTKKLAKRKARIHEVPIGYSGRSYHKLLNQRTPILRRLDGLLPLPPLSLIAIVERRPAGADRTRV